MVVLLGPASAAMHATQSTLGGDLDLLSMYLVASFATAYAVTRLVARGTVFFWQVFLLLVAACQLVGLYPREVPVVTYSGNVAFAVLAVTAISLEVRLARRGPTRRRPAVGRGRARGAGGRVRRLERRAAGTVRPGLARPGPCRLAPARGGGATYLLFRLWASERARVTYSSMV